MEDTALQQATIDQEKYKSIYFRMNFYILKAIYIKLIEWINATYPDVSLSSKKKDFFIIPMSLKTNPSDMLSNRKTLS